MMPSFCPHCGFDLRADEPLALHGLAIDPRTHTATWNGDRLRLSNTLFIILYSLAKAWPAYVPRAALCERIDYDGADPGNLFGVYIHRLRQAGLPIRTIPAAGYAWAGDGVSSC